MGRTSFYTQAQYDNHTALIGKEDAARVRGIVRARELPEQQREEQARIDRFRASERAQAETRQREIDALDEAIERRKLHDERVRLRQSQRRASNSAPKHLSATDRAAAKQRSARILELSQPKTQEAEAMYGSGTYGYVMHQRGHDVIFPEGRNGAPYSPGVDRHRIVPARPDLTHSTPPWVGSYSTHHGTHSEVEQKAASRYDLAASKRTAEERRTRQAALAQLEADQQARHRGVETAETAEHATAVSRAAVANEEEAYNDDADDDIPSVFSHTSSNGPVADTGCQHMGLQSTKPGVRQHLTQGGSAALRTSRGPTKVVNFETLTLPELSTRIVRMQKRTV